FSGRRHGDLTRLAAAGTAASQLGDSSMIIAYHSVFTTYGTWLPNDPRGSYSKEIYKAELAELGEIKYGRQTPQPGRKVVRRFRTAATLRLSRPPYYIKGSTRPVVAAAFATVVARLKLSVPACSIMNDHVHLLVLRSKYRIEYVVNQFKGAATSVLELKRTPWTRRSWNVFLNDEAALRAAAAYVEANPVAAGLKRQVWDFVTPLPPEE
ncbi:MAG: transposase, partial [Planctomycetota bacterium]